MALDHYVESGIGERIRQFESLPPREAIQAFFEEIVIRSLSDREHKGCMVVNSALELAPHDAEFRKIIAKASLASRHSSSDVSRQGRGAARSRVPSAREISRSISWPC